MLRFFTSLIVLAAVSPVSAQILLYSEDFNAGGGAFTTSSNPAAHPGPWGYSATDGVGGTGAWRADGNPLSGIAGEHLLISPVIAVAGTGAVTLEFDHLYNFENDNTSVPPTLTRWDGGIVDLSVNGGAFTQIPSSAFSQNGYDGPISAISSISGIFGPVDVFNGSSNQPDPLNPGIFGTNPGNGTFEHTIAMIGDFASGDTLQFRFRGGWDEFVNFSPGWIIDNLVVTQVPEPASIAIWSLLGLGLAGFCYCRIRRKR